MCVTKYRVEQAFFGRETSFHKRRAKQVLLTNVVKRASLVNKQQIHRGL